MEDLGEGNQWSEYTVWKNILKKLNLKFHYTDSKPDKLGEQQRSRGSLHKGWTDTHMRKYYQRYKFIWKVTNNINNQDNMSPPNINTAILMLPENATEMTHKNNYKHVQGTQRGYE